MKLTDSQKNTIEFLKKYSFGCVKNPEEGLCGMCIKTEENYLIRLYDNNEDGDNKNEFVFSSIEELLKEGWILD